MKNINKIRKTNKNLKENKSNLKETVKNNDFITLRQWAKAPAGTYCNDNNFATLKITDDLYLTSEGWEPLGDVENAQDFLMSCKENNKNMSDKELDEPWVYSEYYIGDDSVTEDDICDFFYFIEEVDDEDFEDEFECSKKHYNKLIKQIMKIHQKYKSKNESLKETVSDLSDDEEKIIKSMKDAHFTDHGAHNYIKAKRMGLDKWYDEYLGNFAFDKKDYEANKDKINKWADENEYYGIVDEPADAYGEDGYLDKSEDGRAYFLTNLWDGGYENDKYQHIIRMPKRKYDEDYGLEESCKGKSCKSKKQLQETFAGEDVIDDLVDRAKLCINDGYDTEDAIWQAIDEGLIYTKDIYDLVEHYGSIDTSTMIESFYDDLYQDIYNELEDYESEEDDDLDDEIEDEYEEGLKRNFKKNLNNKKELDEKYDGTYASDNVSATKEWSRGNNRTYMRVYLTIGNNTYKGTYSYINRPWERFNYQSALLDASRKAGIDVEQLRNLNSFNEIVDKIAELVSKKNEGLNEENELKESAYALIPRYDGRNSFYGKAVVEIQPDGTKILYSYDTPVCKIENGKVILGKGRDRGYSYLVWKVSQTTLRHVKEFLKQEGFKADSVSQIEKDYEADFLRNSDKY